MVVYPLIVLASASPRRAELLQQVGIPFVRRPSEIDESIDTAMPPRDVVRELAEQKAHDITSAGSLPEQAAAVVAADTLVVVDDEILGKPANAADAAAMLTRLQGRAHVVMTGVCINWLPPSGSVATTSWTESTTVWFRPLRDEEIRNYVQRERPFDKAGGYAIQHAAAAFVERIDGCYFNVVGLPLARLSSLLANIPTL